MEKTSCSVKLDNSANRISAPFGFGDRSLIPTQEANDCGAFKQMGERVERLDRSIDFVLVFLSIISAAIFQYVTALPYDPSNKLDLALFIFFMRFSLKLLFLPILVIIPPWLALHIARSENRRMLLRTFVWYFSSVTMALNTVILIVLGFPFKMEFPLTLEYPVFIYAIIIVAVPFALALVLELTVFRSYTRALMMDAQALAHDFFFRRRWRIAVFVSDFIGLLLWLLILWASISLPAFVAPP